MLGRALLISLAVNLVLGAAILLSIVLGSRPQQAGIVEGPPPLRLEALRLVRVERPGAEPLTAERTPLGWVGRRGEDGPAMVLDADRILASCRLLRDGLRAAESQDEPTDPLRIELSTETGAALIELGEPGLGGVAPARLVMDDHEPMAMTASAELYRLWAGGFDGWRPRTVFAGMGENASRLTLGVGQTKLAVARSAGRWGITYPVSAPADADAVRAVLASLASMRVLARPESGARAGLDRPVAELTVEQDARVTVGGEVRVETTRWSLTIGAQSDIDGEARFASISARRVARTPQGTVEVASWGPELIEIASDDLRGISTDPSGVVARRAVQEPSADVRVIEIVLSGSESGDAYRRELGRWRSGSAGGSPSAETVRWLDRTLAWICDRSADEAVFFVPDGWRDIATLRVRGAQGSHTLFVGAIDLPSGVVVGIGDGTVWRVYTGEDAAQVTGWLASRAG